jgi:DNA-binding Lrp family transcriptional regulator
VKWYYALSVDFDSKCSAILLNLIIILRNLTKWISKVINEQDQQLLSVLRSNARASISDLARVLNLSRSTEQNRIAKLENAGVIKGYAVEYGADYLASLVCAHISIKVVQKLTAKTNTALRKIGQLSALYAISGDYDLIAVIEAQSLSELNQIIDNIAQLAGVERTNSSVILETKFKR